MRNHASKDTQTLLASSARTATAAVTFNSPCIGGIVVINVSAATGSPSVTFTLAGLDPASDTAYTILASAAITGTGTTVLRIHPSLTASANAIAKDVLPEAMKLTAAHGNTDSITYSVGFIGV